MLVLNEYWLQTWLDKKINVDHSHDFLLRQGFEMEPVDLIHTQGLVVGQIESISKHPDADKLNVCSVSIGDGDNLQIVCGCSSVEQGLKVAVALVGTDLGGFKIAKRKLRGVESSGMLCSQSELGLKSLSSGIWHLNPSAPVGQPLDDYLQRSGHSYGIEITPNRGDCLSLRGMAREFSIGMSSQMSAPWDFGISAVLSLPSRDGICVSDEAKSFLDSFYLLRLERDVDGGVSLTPDWMKVRLLEAGFGLHHCVVDVLNYVMLETGQPLHAYGSNLSDDFSLQMGHDEKIKLLNGQEVDLDEETLVICNSGKPVCIAGYMGGEDSKCRVDDDAIYLEAACFDSAKVAYHCRRYVDHTQSGSRFERGIDFNFTKQALQRAVNLLHEYANYKPVYRLSYDTYELVGKPLVFDTDYPEKVLGFSYEIESIETALKSSGCSVELKEGKLSVVPPSWRNDLRLPETIVSELLRLLGMPEVLNHSLPLNLESNVSQFAKQDQFVDALKQLMMGSGFCETYSYSFESDEDAVCFSQDDSLVMLKNPISHAFNALRATMFSGLLKQVKRNISKQIIDVRLFEIGHCFERKDGEILERQVLSAALTGFDLKESWLGSKRLSFYHAKSLLEHIFLMCGKKLFGLLEWREESILGFHPHQGGRFYHDNRPVATCGLLHPKLAKLDKINEKIYFISLDLEWLKGHWSTDGHYDQVSNQPMMRRDLSLVVPHGVSYGDIEKLIDLNVSKYLKKAVIFDIYNGDQIPNGFYSLSIGLLFQDALRTLQDEDLVPSIENLMKDLEMKLNIRHRGG